MRGGLVRGALLVAALIGATAVAEGQAGMRPVVVGQAVNGTFTAQDPKFESRGAFHAYRFEAKAGTRYVITMTSGDIDAYVWVARIVGGLTEELGADDDGAGDTDARLRFRAPAAGSYVVVAQSLEVPALGSYVLRVEEAPPSVPATPVALAIGQAREGSLDDRSPVLEDDDAAVPYQLYTFTGTGQRVRVAVRSGAFDAALKVTRVTAGGEEEVGTDDDGGGGTDAQLILTASGDYRIYARALEADKSGVFSVSITEVVVRPVVSRPLAIGQTVEATLASTDTELDDGRPFHQYTIEGRPGERYIVTMRSRAFDAYLDWGRLAAGVFDATASDDDSAGDTDARLEITLPSEGVFVLRAHALERGQSGAYTISVERRTSK